MNSKKQAYGINSVIDMWLGEQIRHRRRSLSLSLKQVSLQSGISLSLLSQIERGISALSVSNMQKISQALDIPIEHLMRNFQHADGGVDAPHVERVGSHRTIDLSDKGIIKENLTPAACVGLEMYRVEILPGGSTGEAFFYTHKGQQLGYVLAGILELNINNRLFIIKQGDSFTYTGEVPRKWRNPGEEKTTVIWSLTKIPDATD